MSLRPQPLSPVPENTTRVARAAFRRSNPYLLLRDRLGSVFADADFADLYPRRGQPAYAPWRLALVTLMQFREGLSDRQAADAVRGRIDWKHLLALELDDAGFDFSVLCEFRARLLEHEAAGRLLDRLLDAAREGRLLKARGRSRTDSTHVLAAVRALNRLELLGETLRAALNAIAAVAPDWLRALAPPEWHGRYDRRVEGARLPGSAPKRASYAIQTGADGFCLLDAVNGADAPESVRELPAIGVLRRVWARHFERVASGSGDDGAGGGGDQAAGRVRLRPAQGRGPGDRVESPYDTEVRFRSKHSTNWTGYMVHLTETCDAEAPRLIVHAEAVPANVHEAMRDLRHPRRAGRQGAGPVRAPGLRGLRQRPSHRRRARAPWHRARRASATGPELAGAGGGRVPRRRLHSGLGEPTGALPGGAHQHRLARAHQAILGPASHPSRLQPCGLPSVPVAPALHAGAEPPARPPAAPRARGGRGGQGAAGDRGGPRTLPPAPRRGGHDLARRVRAFGLRRARYRGLAKAGLQSIVTAAAIDLDRLAAWLDSRPLAPTRTSRFAALAA